MNLTKSRYVAFRQCPKALWLAVNKPEEAAQADESRMAVGIAVGNLSKGYFGAYQEATVTKADGCLDIPAMNGSFSIKKVLPALFPDDPTLDYHNLSGCVHNGGEAMEIFPKMRDMEGQELANTRESLLRYCELDTWSMVVVLRKLYEVSK